MAYISHCCLRSFCFLEISVMPDSTHMQNTSQAIVPHCQLFQSLLMSLPLHFLSLLIVASSHQHPVSVCIYIHNRLNYLHVCMLQVLGYGTRCLRLFLTSANTGNIKRTKAPNDVKWPPKLKLRRLEGPEELVHGEMISQPKC